MSKQEPVAWLVDTVITYSDDIAQELASESGKPIIPLYTAPRELSDEEIKTLHEETSWFGITDPVKFARAILKKANEK
jgi:hypothetical protein